MAWTIGPSELPYARASVLTSDPVRLPVIPVGHGGPTLLALNHCAESVMSPGVFVLVCLPFAR